MIDCAADEPDEGVWVAWYADFSGYALFDDELTALRHALDHSMYQVSFVPFGVSVREHLSKA